MNCSKVINSKWIYLIFLLNYIFCYFLFECNLLKINNNHRVLLQIYCLGVIIIILLLAVDTYRENKPFENVILGIIVLGVAVRLQRIIGLPWNRYQHDVLGSNVGHYTYMMYILNNGHLPQSYAGQFYHPPLHHIICAIWLKINLAWGVSMTTAMEGLQYLMAFYSSVVMVLGYKIFVEIGLKRWNLVICTAFIALGPLFIRLSSSLNNDGLMTLFCFAVTLYSLYWYKHATCKNISILGLLLGLGMMTKLNVVLCAPAIAIMFLIKLIQGESTEIKNYIYQYSVFASISIPLGMWYSIRNYIKFDQPLGYVLKYQDTVPGYIGNYNLEERFFSIPFMTQVVKLPLCHLTKDYNLITYIIKNADVGEYCVFFESKIIPILHIINAALILIALMCMIYFIIFIKNRYREKVVFGVTWLVQIISFLSFCIKYPFVFTMDCRYIVLTILEGIVFIGLIIEELRSRDKILEYITKLFSMIIVLYCSLSTFIYLFLW